MPRKKVERLWGVYAGQPKVITRQKPPDMGTATEGRSSALCGALHKAEETTLGLISTTVSS